MFYNFIRIQYIMGKVDDIKLDIYFSKGLITEEQKQMIINSKGE